MRASIPLVLLLVLSVTASAQIKKPEPPPVKTPFPESLQAFVVTTETQAAVQGKARLYQRASVRSKWKQVGDGFPVVVGRNGLGWSVDTAPEDVADLKREGDGRSPAGLFPLTFAFGRPDNPGGVLLPYRKLGEYSECVDDAASSHYNKLVDRMRVGNFDWKSSERMLEVGPEYDLGVFVAHNSYPVRPGDGSCIFLHVWKDASTGTAGCTAMGRGDLIRVLKWADPAKHPYLVQMTEADRKKYQKSWNLPKH